MKALSVHPEWTALIASGAKSIEVRGCRTRHRGPLLVCTTKRPAAVGVPGGVALCLVDVVDCRPMVPTDAPAACCADEPGAFAWVLSNPRPVARVPVRGRLGLFEVADALLEQVLR
jgi:hypothetical protein